MTYFQHKTRHMVASEPWSGFDAWLVDLDGTLYRAAPVRLAMAAELLIMGPHCIRTIQRFRHVQELMRQQQDDASHDAHANGHSPYERQLTLTAEAMGCSSADLAHVVREWMERRPAKWLRLFRRRALLAEIALFRARGGKTALVSDYPAQAKLVGLGVASLFDVIVACGDEGGPNRLKPAPEGYLLAANRLGVLPSHCLVIGDRPDTDGEAARRALMTFRCIL